MVDGVQIVDEEVDINLEDFDFTSCDSFSADFSSSSASMLWYKAGQTAIYNN